MDVMVRVMVGAESSYHSLQCLLPYLILHLLGSAVVRTARLRGFSHSYLPQLHRLLPHGAGVLEKYCFTTSSGRYVKELGGL